MAIKVKNIKSLFGEQKSHSVDTFVAIRVFVSPSLVRPSIDLSTEGFLFFRGIL